MPRPGIPDPFRIRARAEGYVARAVYKLKEIDEKYRLFREGIGSWIWAAVPGPGCNTSPPGWAPGAWCWGWTPAQLAIPLAPPLYFIRAEVGSLDLETISAISPVFEVVVSDLAPKTTGVREVDQQRSLELAWQALEVGPPVSGARGPFPGEDLCRARPASPGRGPARGLSRLPAGETRRLPAGQPGALSAGSPPARRTQGAQES